jgi:hypothetical protein
MIYGCTSESPYLALSVNPGLNIDLELRMNLMLSAKEDITAPLALSERRSQGG